MCGGSLDQFVNIKLVGMSDEHRCDCTKANLQEVIQITKFQVAVFQNNIQDHEKVNVKSLDETHRTFNTDCTQRAKGWISFTTMANTGLATHFCRLCPPMPLSLIDTSLLTVTQHIQLKFTYNTALLYQSSTLYGIPLSEPQHSDQCSLSAD